MLQNCTQLQIQMLRKCYQIILAKYFFPDPAERLRCNTQVIRNMIQLHPLKDFGKLVKQVFVTFSCRKHLQIDTLLHQF